MDGKKVYALEVQGDFLNKQTFAKPAQALAELIWNSLDADATIVDIAEDSYNGLGSRIIVSDNGTGFAHADAPDLFKHLGGSWKHLAGGMSKGSQRFLHGSEGKGRLKAFALGRVVDWEVCHKEGGAFVDFTISMLGNALREVHISGPQPAKQKFAGVRCVISELYKPPEFLYSEQLLQELSGLFAIYLKNYPDVQITLPAGKLDMSVAIASNKVVRLEKIVVDDKEYPVELEIIGWKKPTDRTLFLCNEAGLPLRQSDIRLQVPGFNFSAYLKSPYISVLSHAGMLELAEMTSVLAATIEAAKEAVKKFYRELQSVNAQTVVERWKEQRIYPYVSAPHSLVERIEREVFDIVAVKVNNLMPDFDASPVKGKKLQLRMLRQTIEKSPEALQLILTEVLDLPVKKQKEFAKLLKETTLTAIIGASKVISERLGRLTDLDALLFAQDTKKQHKEQLQLQRLLADNTWLFGEAFSLSVDDQMLTDVLQAHLDKRRTDSAEAMPAKRDEGIGVSMETIVARSIPSHREDELAHLVVEFKRPGAVIDAHEIAHMKRYAFALQDDVRFTEVHTRWTFWMIAHDIHTTDNDDNGQAYWPKGLVFRSENNDITIWVKTWAQLLDGNRQRLHLFKESLEINADREGALEFLRDNYSEVLGALEGTVTDADDVAKEALVA